jgi:hypothetical protein
VVAARALAVVAHDDDGGVVWSPALLLPHPWLPTAADTANASSGRINRSTPLASGAHMNALVSATANAAGSTRGAE